jgi:WD40 repeat protein
VATGSDHTVCIYNIEKGVARHCVDVGSAVNALRFNQKGTLLAVGGRNAEIALLRSDSGNTQAQFSLNRKHHVDPGDGGRASDLPVWVESFAFRLDDRVLSVGGSDGVINFVDIDTKQMKTKRLTGRLNAVFGLCFDPPGSRLVSASSDGSVWFWRTGPGIEQGLPFRTDASTQHVACSKDFQMVAVANGNSVSVFDTVKNIRISDPLTGPSSFFNSVTISEDGQNLAAASDDEVLVWTLKAEELARKACQIANRSLTLEEWRQYFGKDRAISRFMLLCRGLVLESRFQKTLQAERPKSPVKLADRFRSPPAP